VIVLSGSKVVRTAKTKKARGQIYKLIEKVNREEDWTIRDLCKVLHVSRTAYYRWKKSGIGQETPDNQTILFKIEEICAENNHLFGYRKMTMAVNRNLGLTVNVKRIRRLMRINGIDCLYRKKKHYNYRRSTPEETADNILNRDFNASHPNEKWVTDITEIKCPGLNQKIYVSSILDLYDRSIVACQISLRNDVRLVEDTLKEALEKYPEGPKLFHSDRGFQYTRKVFQNKLAQLNIVQSMSRVGRCIDNGPMESIQGILKDMVKVLFPQAKSPEELAKAVLRTIEVYHWNYPQERFNGKTAAEVRREALGVEESMMSQYPIKVNRKIQAYWDNIAQKKAASKLETANF
jgi:transposase InsO family protein